MLSSSFLIDGSRAPLVLMEEDTQHASGGALTVIVRSFLHSDHRPQSQGVLVIMPSL